MKNLQKRDRLDRLRKIKRRRRIWLICLCAALLTAAAAGMLYRRESRAAIPAWVPMDGEYPVSVLEFAQKYPQAADFAAEFPQKASRHRRISVDAELSQGGFPLFLQWDERWGYELYGDDFLGVNGCGPTSLSMVRCGLGGDGRWNPYEVAKMAEKNGFYVSGVGSSWELMTTGANEIGLTVHEVPFSAQGILDTLSAGMPIICSMGPGEFTFSGHFVVLTGLNADGSVRINDSNSRERSQKAWGADYLLANAVAMWAYSYQN